MPKRNFSWTSKSFGLFERESIDEYAVILWAIDLDGVYSELNLNHFFEFSHNPGKDFHFLKLGWGFSDELIYKSSELTKKENLCFLQVTTTDNVKSSVLLDAFVGIESHRLIFSKTSLF